jgi:hypothetical protein
MPVPTPETALLNRFFETHRNRNPPPPTAPLTSDEKDALESYQFGLQQVGAQSVSTASTPSTSTLALEDDEIRNIFTSEKSDADSLVEDDLHTPRRSVNTTNGGNRQGPPTTQDRRLSVDELNPNAMPFVPALLPNLASAPASVVPTSVPTSNYRRLLRPAPGDTLPTLIPRWLRTLRRAMDMSASTTPDYDVLLMVIVNSERWDTSEVMAELAQEFTWNGTADIPRQQVSLIAAFAQEVYEKFRHMRGEEYGQSFLWHIKEAVLGTYMSVWDAVSYQAYDKSKTNH